MEAQHAISSEIYAKAKQSAGGPETPGAGAPGGDAESKSSDAKGKKGGKEGDVIDADFEMVDEDKKK